ncbi:MULTISPECIES: cell surface protein [Streptococcus]|uniref:cell surface protein n=1 Tax=Streptococcus TaxID=1301 RepID=UPI002096F354|nr:MULTISPECIES: cell surface protein [Streptococcus]MCO7178660.1 cell surface protein [Streptococcus gallolyticus]MCO7182171.1 cell surface protein [Streptococcus gallolyticus]
MKKSKILTMVTLSTLVLAQAGRAFADESDIAGTVDDTVVVTPSTTGSDSSTDKTDTSNAGDDVNDTIDSGSGVIETPTTPITDDSSSETTPSTETDVVGETTQTETSSSDNSEDKSDTQTDSGETQTETSDSQTEDDTSQQNQETGTVEVPTTTGETATVNTDKSQATNNPNVSAQTAYDAGASQVGTTSQVTSQIVRDVTTANPVTLISGVTITDIQAGVATLSDGSNASLTDLGVTENADKTFTATTIDGEQVTLPETGESAIGVIVGLLIILAGFGLGFKDKLKALVDKVKAKSKK